jgi:hypothetical protein
VSSEDSEACIVNQLRVYHKSKEHILFFFLLLMDVGFGNPLWDVDLFMF